ncbi:MAG TPA: LptA/OstA family protein [Acidobacteriaceae bacterium]|nr:LptA/OstA family protein [Acidobacteriaceae bacterium]
MRNRVERLRIWLLGCAGFLLLVIVAFLGSARYLKHRMRAYLPEKLAANVKIDQNGVTFCDTVGPITVYCIHAARELEHTDGKISLHDVLINLYGKNGDRNDRIQGDEFEYDKNAGVVRALGLVNLDLQAAQPSGETAAGGAANPKVLHVTTSGLVYLEKLGVAATSEAIEFESGTMTGHATGADYNSDSGVLTMHSSVSMNDLAGKRPVQVTAATAELDNRNRQIFMTGSRCVSQGQTVEAQQATLHTRPDGTLSRVEAQGNVTREVKGTKLVSQRVDVVLGARSQPQSAAMTGGVQYSSDMPLLQRSGHAEEATVAFDAQGQAKQAVFTGAVHMVERTRATEAAREPWSSRDLTAAKVVVALVQVGGGTPQVRDAEATGSAHLTAVNYGTLASSKDIGNEELSADVLTAHMAGGNGKQPPQLDTVAGRGHTLLHQVKADGTEQTSTGDTLDAKFRAQHPASAVAGRQTSLSGSGGAPVMLLSAVQQGHVAMTRRAPAKAAAKAGSTQAKTGNASEDVQHATAERAAYDGDLDRMTLTGGVQMSDAGSLLWAKQIVFDPKTGDAQASGTVKMDYSQDASPPASGLQTTPAEPTYIVADRAEFVHRDDTATFFGMPVRLWQGGSQVQAPVIEFDRLQQRLTARGVASAGVAQTAQVHTVLVSAGSGDSSAAKAGADKTTGEKAAANKPRSAARPPTVMRIASGELVYSGSLHQAEFSGGVRAETIDGTVRANQATVYLMQKAGQRPLSSGEEVPSITGNLERMVATGQIEIEQPGRHATGERLQYTANDQLFVLTGDDLAQPKMMDAAHGTITGAAIMFHTGDDSIVVSNTEPGAASTVAGRRVRTETHADKDATMGRGK